MNQSEQGRNPLKSNPNRLQGDRAGLREQHFLVNRWPQLTGERHKQAVNHVNHVKDERKIRMANGEMIHLGVQRFSVYIHAGVPLLTWQDDDKENLNINNEVIIGQNRDRGTSDTPTGWPEPDSGLSHMNRRAIRSVHTESYTSLIVGL